MVQLSPDLFNLIVSYLAACPYSEVAQLLARVEAEVRPQLNSQNQVQGQTTNETSPQEKSA